MEVFTDLEEKKHGLSVLMSHYMGQEEGSFPAAAVEKTTVFRLEVKVWSCKEHGG